jgi:hypothetical protein
MVVLSARDVDQLEAGGLVDRRGRAARRTEDEVAGDVVAGEPPRGSAGGAGTVLGGLLDD